MMLIFLNSWRRAAAAPGIGEPLRGGGAVAEVALRRVDDVLALQLHLAQQAVVGVDRLHELGEVLPGAEVVAGAADHEHLHVVVDVRLVQQVGVAEPHPDRRRVEPLGTVEGERGDLGVGILLVEDPARVVSAPRSSLIESIPR